ncbi:MAG: hypothetical protein R3E08_08790 [Thiotrichaceae bacterium]
MQDAIEAQARHWQQQLENQLANETLDVTLPGRGHGVGFTSNYANDAADSNYLLKSVLLSNMVRMEDDDL